MTAEVGIIQFSKINRPDIESGYTLDDNARALIALCQHYQLTGHASDLKYIKIYFNFIQCCFRHDGKFLNYVDKDCQFTEQNDSENLEDALYNPCTGGFYDGLELHNVNLNQGAESTVSYLLARMAFEFIGY